MIGLNKLALWVMTGVLGITTVFFNSYISLMSVLNYKEKKQWTPCETITMALSVASIAHQMTCYFWMTMDEVDSDCQIAQIGYAILLVLTFSFKFTIMWNSSFLTFYYSTKLVHEPNHCYTHAQDVIVKHVTVAVILIPLFGFGTCLPMLVLFNAGNAATNGDCGLVFSDTTSVKVYQVMYLLLSDVFPGVVMVKCCISISVHLAIHLQHMKASTNGTHPPKLGTQIRVIEMALGLVANFLVLLVVDLYVNYKIVAHQESTLSLTMFFTSLYTTVAAVVPEQKTQASLPSKVKNWGGKKKPICFLLEVFVLKSIGHCLNLLKNFEVFFYLLC
uniref:Taste receptor type 2 n=1 Tax=Oreochromis aureus TaxID=47969 RepID=A0AAZ1X3Y4_OREAU